MSAKSRRTASDSDYLQIYLINRFMSDLNMTYEERAKVLGLSPERTLEILMRRDQRLFLSERLRIQTADSLLKNGLLLLLDWSSFCSWICGPYPHSRFAGATPLEQIRNGGFPVLVRIASSLEMGIVNRAIGLHTPVPPPAHFDLIYGR